MSSFPESSFLYFFFTCYLSFIQISKNRFNYPLRFIQKSKIVLITQTIRMCACGNNYLKCVNTKCCVLMLLCFCIYFRGLWEENIIQETSMMGCNFNVFANYWVQLNYERNFCCKRFSINLPKAITNETFGYNSLIHKVSQNSFGKTL